MSRIILRPGHGMTFSEKQQRWTLQRPGNREDDWTAHFCSEHLIPALVAQQHEVVCQRAIDSTSGQLDTTETTVDDSIIPGLPRATTEPRWRFNATVEGALQGVEVCRQYSDPKGSCRWEREIPVEQDDEIYLSIHQNWVDDSDPYGFLALHHHNSSKGEKRAKKIYNAVASAFADDWGADAHTGWSHRPKGCAWDCRGDSLYELNLTHRPAVLLELGFVSNDHDRQLMNDPQWRQQMAKAIADGI